MLTLVGVLSAIILILVIVMNSKITAIKTEMNEQNGQLKEQLAAAAAPVEDGEEEAQVFASIMGAVSEELQIPVEELTFSIRECA